MRPKLYAQPMRSKGIRLVVWLVGMAGAGKTSIGRHLYEDWKASCPSLVYLDGDNLRQVFGNDLGHSAEDRKRNAERICGLCSLLDSQGINVVCSILSVFESSRDWNRRNLSSYFEVYVKASLETLLRRDQKSLYSGAMSGHIKNVVGFDIPFEEPKRPDLVIENDSEKSPPELHAKVILERLMEALK